MGRNKTLLRNTSWVVIGNVGSKMVGFFMLPFYTHWLSPSDYGITSLVSTYAMLLINIVALDVADAIFVFPFGETKENIKKYFSTGLLFQIICVVILLLAFYVLSQFKLDGSFFKYIWFVCGLLISQLFQSYTQNFCRAIDKMTVFCYTGVVCSFCTSLLSICLIPKYGLIGYMTSMIVSNLITTLFTFLYSKSYQYTSLCSFKWSYLIKMTRYSIPLMPTAMMWWFINSLNKPLLEANTGLFAIGLMEVSSKLPSIMNMIFGFFQQAWMITVMDELKSKDFETYYNKMLKIIFTVQVFISLLMAFLAFPMVRLFTSEKYYSAWLYIPVMCLSTLFSNVSAFTGTIFTANKNSKSIFYSTIIAGIISVLMNYFLIPRFGLWGACFSMVIAFACSAITRIMMGWKTVKICNLTYYFINVLFVLASIACCLSHKSSFRYLGLILILALFLIYNYRSIFSALRFLKIKIGKE